MRLGFVAVGPERTGTTWLHACLLGHTQLCLAARSKETGFFDRHFDRGWDWYWDHFDCRPGQTIAEIGPTYFYRPIATERLHAHNPDCRILISLRDPTARSFSFYLHLRKRGYVEGTFEQAIERHPMILDSSRYGTHVPRWLDHFGSERVLLITQEEIAATPDELLARVCEFAGIEVRDVPEAARRRVNAASLPAHPSFARSATRIGDWLRARRLLAPISLAKRLGLRRVYGGGDMPRLAEPMRRRLIAEFEPDIAYVERLLGIAKPAWRAARAEEPAVATAEEGFE